MIESGGNVVESAALKKSPSPVRAGLLSSRSSRVRRPSIAFQPTLFNIIRSPRPQKTVITRLDIPWQATWSGVPQRPNAHYQVPDKRITAFNDGLQTARQMQVFQRRFSAVGVLSGHSVSLNL